MVLLAKVWKSAPPRFHCEAGTIDHAAQIPTTGELVLELNTDACVGTATEVNYLEHVQVPFPVEAILIPLPINSGHCLIEQFASW
jgi:proprotein convertase subtilisin/kexin type 2